MKNNKPLNTKFFSQIVDLPQSARNKVVHAINQTMITTYFEIGRMIVEEEQNGKNGAEYGKGFSTTNLKQVRQFYKPERKTHHSGRVDGM